MKWIEVTAATSHEAVEAVSEIFGELGASGVAIEDAALINRYIDSGVWDYTDLKKTENTAVVFVKAYLPFENELKKKLDLLRKKIDGLAACGINPAPAKISTAELEDEDWSESWKKYFHTTKIGERIVIKPTWEKYEKKADEAVIELDPGAAFGTGTHPTSAMCIRELERIVKDGAFVIDVGTGSGILAVAAAKLGAKKVLALDNDETAAKTARENVAQNGAADAVTVRVGDLLAGVTASADVIVANIIADVVIKMLADAKRLLADGGRIILSGIIDERRDDVTRAATGHGFAVEKIVGEKGWTAIVLRRGEQ